MRGPTLCWAIRRCGCHLRRRARSREPSGMDTPTAELEIELHRWDAGRHTVELRFRRPDSDADISPARGLVRFDTAALLALAIDPDAYGQELSRQLFAVDEVREQLEQARAVVEAKG